MYKLWSSIMKSKMVHPMKMSDSNLQSSPDIHIDVEPQIKLFRVSDANYYWSRAGQLQAEMDTTPSEKLKMDESK